MLGNRHLPLQAALEEVHDHQQRLARWIHDELAGNVNALQLLLQCQDIEGGLRPQDVLSRLRQSLVRLETILSPAALAHLGFAEAMSQLLRGPAVTVAPLAVLPEQPVGATAACLYRCAELAVAGAAPGRMLCWELERTPAFWQLRLGPVEGGAGPRPDSREPPAFWSPTLLEAWVCSQGGELDWAANTPWGKGLCVRLPLR